MNSFPTMFVYVGIAVLAIVVIFLVVWVSRLSSKIKRLTDAMMIDPAQPRRQGSQGSYGAYGTGARGGYSSFDGAAAGVQPSMASQGSYAGHGASSRQPVAAVRQQPVQHAQQVTHSETSSGMRVVSDAGKRGAYQEEDEFFENYRDRDDAQFNKGRSKPNIPFGADKNIIDRRRETYSGSAADLDYDPDSIDFTRVQGYRNLYR